MTEDDHQEAVLDSSARLPEARERADGGGDAAEGLTEAEVEAEADAQVETRLREKCESAQNGHAQDALELGRAFEHGDVDQGVPRSTTNAARYYKIAAELGLADAQYALGTLQAEGYQKRIPSAVSWLRKAVEQGHPAACTKLALILQRGLDVEGDRAER